MTDSERTALAGLETKIEAGLATFLQVGTCLTVIRDGRLYREHYATFEDYLDQRWGISKSYGHRMIVAAQAVEAVEATGMVPIGTITSESQARELRDLEPEVAAQVVTEVAAEGPVTAKAIKAKRTELTEPVSEEGTFVVPATLEEAAAHLDSLGDRDDDEAEWQRAAIVAAYGMTVHGIRQVWDQLSETLVLVADAIAGNAEETRPTPDARIRIQAACVRILAAIDGVDAATWLESARDEVVAE